MMETMDVVMQNGIEMVRIQLIPDRMLLREEPVHNVAVASDIAMDELSNLDREVFCVLNLNVKGQVINMNVVSVGSLCSTEIHPREVFKSSILSNAGSIIAMHNHPSGDPTPSEADIESTKRLVEAGELLGIPLLDHIIVGCQTNKCYSLKEHEDM